jgi:hypothetical protein
MRFNLRPVSIFAPSAKRPCGLLTVSRWPASVAFWSRARR